MKNLTAERIEWIIHKFPVEARNLNTAVMLKAVLVQADQLGLLEGEEETALTEVMDLLQQTLAELWRLRG